VCQCHIEKQERGSERGEKIPGEIKSVHFV
jgi:hypothetical protein